MMGVMVVVREEGWGEGEKGEKGEKGLRRNSGGTVEVGVKGGVEACVMGGHTSRYFGNPTSLT